MHVAVCELESTGGKQFAIRASCFRSMRKNSPPHNVKVKLIVAT